MGLPDAVYTVATLATAARDVAIATFGAPWGPIQKSRNVQLNTDNRRVAHFVTANKDVVISYTQRDAMFSCQIAFGAEFAGSVNYAAAFSAGFSFGASFIGSVQYYGAFEAGIAFNSAFGGSATYSGAFSAGIAFGASFAGSLLASGMFDCDITFGSNWTGPMDGSSTDCTINGGADPPEGGGTAIKINRIF